MGFIQPESINLEIIRESLLRNESLIAPMGSVHAFKKAAVLIPLVQYQNFWHIVFTRRSDLVQDHKGQVSFPGGAIEADDPTEESAALRETYEEIGIHPSDIQILGRINSYVTITNYHITPFVGSFVWPYPIRIQQSEVSRVFTIPLKWLSDPKNHDTKNVMLPNGRSEQVVYFREYDGEKLWGITAKITLQFLTLIRVISAN